MLKPPENQRRTEAAQLGKALRFWLLLSIFSEKIAASLPFLSARHVIYFSRI